MLKGLTILPTEYSEWLAICLALVFLLGVWCSVNNAPYVLGEMSESRAKRVRIKEVDGWTLRMLIDYVYTAEIQVTEENVQVRVTAYTIWFFTHDSFLMQKSIPIHRYFVL